jgi:hypothetical protein
MELKDRAFSELIALGASAVPEIESELDSLEQGKAGANANGVAYWMLRAYGRIERSRALPRLMRMLQKRRLAPFADDIERSIAIALDITEYGSTLSYPPRVRHGPFLPQHAAATGGRRAER